MADTLSLAPALIQTGDLASMIAMRIKDYLVASASAPEALNLIRSQLLSLRNILNMVVKYLTIDQVDMTAKGYNDLRSSLGRCAATLRELANVLHKQFAKGLTDRTTIAWSWSKIDLQGYSSKLDYNMEVIRTMVDVLSSHKVEEIKGTEVLSMPGETTGGGEEGSSSSRVSIHTSGSRTDGDDHRVSASDVNEYLLGISYKQRRYFNKLRFEPTATHHIGIKQNEHIGTVSTLVELFDIGLLDALSSRTAMGPESDFNKLSLIVCGATGTTSNLIPFQRDVFVRILKVLFIPPGLFQALFTGTPKSVYYEAGDTSLRGSFVLRAPMSGTENWALAISWEDDYRAVKGIVHGMEDSEMSRLSNYIEDTRVELGHPMNIPLILCEMLMESDANGVKSRASELYQVELRTNYHTSNDQAVSNELLNWYELVDFEGVIQDNNTKGITPAQDFEGMTRSLNTIISRLAFHEMRIQANVVFADQIKEQAKSMYGKYHSRNGPSCGNFLNMSQCLYERLDHLKIEQSALLLEITCNQKIAQSQLEIVYNLVAQRDNKENLNMAAISTDIAETTRDDSFAMRTIAVMSILFLPGTFIASLFSMDMFDWQAPKGATVISFRFWIYWAITVPLILVVFSIWFFWIRTHRRHDNERESGILSQNIDIRTARRLHKRDHFWSRAWRQWRYFRRNFRKSDEEEQIVRRAYGNMMVSSASETLRRRQPPTSIPRADTVIQGPRR